MGLWDTFIAMNYINFLTTRKIDYSKYNKDNILKIENDARSLIKLDQD